MSFDDIRVWWQASAFGRGTKVAAIIGATFGLLLLKVFVRGNERYGSPLDGLELFVIGIASLACGIFACIALWWILLLGYVLLRRVVRAVTKFLDRFNESLMPKDD